MDDAEHAAPAPRAPRPGDDKYSRGVLGMHTGSDAYPGAAVLGVEAAWRTGIGLVRYVGPDRAAQLVLHRRPETVIGDGRVQAWVIGSGMASMATSRDADPAATRPLAVEAALRSILAGDVPVVVDAGALDLAPGAAAPVIVTPHAREHAALRDLLGLAPADPTDDDARAQAAAQTAQALGGVVLLKGARTIIAAPDGHTVRTAEATSWLATAGTGDVLGGVLGALVAAAAADRRLDADALASLALTGARLHARAGELAAAAVGPGGGPITALDVAAALPRAVGEAVA